MCLLIDIVLIIYVVLCCDFGIDCLCIVVVGLNFYVGEGGKMGGEEIVWMNDIIIVFVVEGIDVFGFLLFDMMFYVCV